MNAFSTFLFPEPSFGRGAGSLVDLAGSGARYNQSTSNEAADVRALRADMLAVLHDADRALRELADDVK